MKRLTILLLLIIPFILCTSWGFFAHRRINQLAIFTLPSEMLFFYKANRNYIIEHAVDPDKRRYADTLEAQRHYLDVESYEDHMDDIPKKWIDALQKYGPEQLQRYGILPWAIEKSYFRLVKAFAEKDSLKILKYSSDLGHYVADACVPLHTTRNHNGQLIDQHGIHAFWESRLPELFAENYSLITGKAHYIKSPLELAWQIIKTSHAAVDSVLNLERELHYSFRTDQKYSYVKRNNVISKHYSAAYSKAYQEKTKGMVEKRMRTAIHAVGSLWYSAWIDAGQPVLEHFKKNRPYAKEKKEEKLTEKKYRRGRILGREN